MENTDLGLCKFPAGSNQLVCELYSEHHMEETQKSQLKHLLHEGLK